MNQIEQRKKRLIDTAHLLKQVADGGTTFGDATDDGKRELIHNGKPTGVFISEQLYLAVTNQIHPERPKIAVSDERLYDLTPDLIEVEFPTVYQYVQDCVLYLMLMSNVSADNVGMTITRTKQNEVCYVFHDSKQSDS